MRNGMKEKLWKKEQIHEFMGLLLNVILLSMQCNQLEKAQLPNVQGSLLFNKANKKTCDYRATVIDKKIKTRWEGAIFKSKLPESSFVFIYYEISQSSETIVI